MKQKRKGDGNFEVNIKGDANGNILRNDVGGEDRGPCFPAMPRGCVVCVVCRARTCRSQRCCGFVWLGPELTRGRN